MSKVIAVLMKSGMQMVGKVQGETDLGKVVIQTPRLAQVAVNPADGQVHLSFLPLTVLSEEVIEEVSLEQSDILKLYTPKKTVIDNYLQHVTGIAIANSGNNVSPIKS